VSMLRHARRLPVFQAPWGRSTASDFQVNLAERFHNVLTAKLSGFPFGKDYITVWKRTRYVELNEEDYSAIPDFKYPEINVAEDCQPDVLDDDGASSSSSASIRRSIWADIPAEERIPDFAASAFAHLLNVNDQTPI
jgi:hypothetical protein